ncbi:hypothetical protein [Pseudomonas sp. ICMP 561]|uniref:hypothetical protein n=1 Tax=Pseudomonas sp. ICMP 561 TaxID=1718918 RepID=UPI000C07E8F0|nr:hypothetical protein [Pseudomonas sp. ICMP 561]PHN28978.1 hypothetical protein AO242_26195 [Pseudomonas sp. ICMP 561]
MTAYSGSKKFSLPEKLGIAADLTLGVSDTLGYIADCLLVHDEVVIPLDASSLSVLEDTFGSNQLVALINSGRIKFCASYSIKYANKNTPQSFDRGVFLESVRCDQVFPSGFDRGALFGAIDNAFIDPLNPDYSNWLSAKDQVEESFDYFAKNEKYRHFYPAAQPRFHRAGAILGVARMNDLIAVNIPAMEMDSELPTLLELCFPTLKKNVLNEDAFYLNAQKVIEDLHKIEGLPSFEKLSSKPIHRTDDEIKLIVKAVLSDESEDLRRWLSTNLTADLDVRSAYDKSEKLLPSKRSWTNWLRFGASTGFGTAIGTMIADPFVGLAAGTAIGAADLLFGEKAASVALDSYHPKIWLSHIQRHNIVERSLE